MTQKELESKMLDTILKNEALKEGKTVLQFLEDIKKEALAKQEIK